MGQNLSVQTKGSMRMQLPELGLLPCGAMDTGLLALSTEIIDTKVGEDTEFTCSAKSKILLN